MLCPTFSACCTLLHCEKRARLAPSPTPVGARPADLKSISPIFPFANHIWSHDAKVCSEAPTCVIAGGGGMERGGTALISYRWAD